MSVPPPTPGADRSMGSVATTWAVVGVGLILLHATIRLGMRGLPVLDSLSAAEWAALAVLTAASVYVEGVRAFQRRWLPFVLRRADELRGERRLVLRVLGPLYAMSLVGARPTALLRAWSGITAIVAAVLIVRAFPDPWRGIVDIAVAAALAWGVVHLCVQAIAGAGGRLTVATPASSPSRSMAEAAAGDAPV